MENSRNQSPPLSRLINFWENFQQLDIWSESNNLGESIISPSIIFSESDNVCPDVV
ncbi:hypothetical protein ACP6PL_18015 [Dapis sp. BLCC M126]|uniref:hypothetical protein n=1 Tax=Dapis sp. BLCC M126 TaxID=3400189 RepID=UPI003CF5B41D